MPKWPRTGTLLCAAALAAAAAACQPPEDSGPAADAVVTVRGGSVVRTVTPGLIFGANFGAWVGSEKLGPTTRDLVRALRPSVARFPGGNISNNFCWEEQRVSGNDHLVWEDWSWGTGVAAFLAFLKTVDAAPMFSLMPFDHTIDGRFHSAVDEAAALAATFVAEGFSGAFYEVGNENDGSWNPTLSVADYTDRFVLLVGAVKEVDPAAQSLGPVVSSYNMSWINGFLNRLAALGAAGLLDWISFHHYGSWISGNTGAIDLDDPQDLAGELATIREALAARGLERIKIAVNEMNAAIWDAGSTRDQFTIKQGLWLADALGVCLSGADAANVWIHLHPGSDPHALIDSESSPPRPTRNYGPVALAAQTLSGDDPTAAVDVLPVDLEADPSDLTAYAVRKADRSIGLLLINKSSRALDVEVALQTAPGSVTARRLGAAEYDAGSGAVAATVEVDGARARLSLPARTIAGLDVR